MSHITNDIIDYIEENHSSEFNEIIEILCRVKVKIEDSISECNSMGKYDEIISLAEWAKRFSEIGLPNRVINKVQDLPQAEHNIEKSQDNFDKLVLENEWSNVYPTGVCIETSYYNAFTWKDILGRVYKVLHDKDPKKFKEIVDNDVLHGRKHPSLSDRKLNKDYAPVTSTGYFYKGTPMSAEQARSYIKRVLECYGVESENFYVTIKTNKKKTRSTGNEVSGVDIIDKSKICPSCGGVLENAHKVYRIYDDGRKIGEPKIEKTYIKKCNSCKKEYMTKDTYLSLQKQKSNFDQRIDFKIIKK